MFLFEGSYVCVCVRVCVRVFMYVRTCSYVCTKKKETLSDPKPITLFTPSVRPRSSSPYTRHITPPMGHLTNPTSDVGGRLFQRSPQSVSFRVPRCTVKKDFEVKISISTSLFVPIWTLILYYERSKYFILYSKVCIQSPRPRRGPVPESEALEMRRKSSQNHPSNLLNTTHYLLLFPTPRFRLLPPTRGDRDMDPDDLTLLRP